MWGLSCFQCVAHMWDLHSPTRIDVPLQKFIPKYVCRQAHRLYHTVKKTKSAKLQKATCMCFACRTLHA